MHKEKAIEILVDYLANKCDLCEGLSLPINDEVVTSNLLDDTFQQWTFIGLIKIAYNLKDE